MAEAKASAEAERLTGRIAVLLEETAHQGLLGLRLLMQARDIVARPDDEMRIHLITDLEHRLVALEREGRERLREVRRLLRTGRTRRRAHAVDQRFVSTRSLRSHR